MSQAENPTPVNSSIAEGLAPDATNRPPPPDRTSLRWLAGLIESGREGALDAEKAIQAIDSSYGGWPDAIATGTAKSLRRRAAGRRDPSVDEIIAKFDDGADGDGIDHAMNDEHGLHPVEVHAAAFLRCTDGLQANVKKALAGLTKLDALLDARDQVAALVPDVDADRKRDAEIEATWYAIHPRTEQPKSDPRIEHEAYESGVGQTAVYLATFRGPVVGYGTTESAAKRETERHAKYDRSAPAELVDHLDEVVIERVEAETPEALAEITDARCTPGMATNVEYAIWSSKAEDAMPADRRRARHRRMALCGIEAGIAMSLSGARDVGWTHDDLVEQFSRLVAAHREGGRAALSAIIDEVR